jgi:hypothetical protein
MLHIIQCIKVIWFFLTSKQKQWTWQTTYWHSLPYGTTWFDDPLNQHSALSALKQNLAESHVCQLLCLWVNHLPLDITPIHTGMYSDCYKLAMVHFDTWSSNKELITALHSYAQTVASYVTCRWDQESLNHSTSITGKINYLKVKSEGNALQNDQKDNCSFLACRINF